MAASRPLHIVQAAAFPYPTAQGSQVFVRGMARGLAERGHEVTVVCYAHGDGHLDSNYSVRRTPRIPGYSNLRAGPDWVKPFLDVALIERIASVKADIVHAHNYEAAIAALMAKQITGIPVVYNAHNTMGEELPTYFQARSMRAIASRFGNWLDKTVPRLADHAVVLNPTAVQTLLELGCDAVSCVEPGVDPADFDGQVPANLPGERWVVYAGNPDQYQDLDVLIEAMRLIPDVGLLLVSASSLRDWEGCGLQRLQCIQTSDFDVVKGCIAACEVAALPRSVCSGFPIKLLNYLGLGVPAVVAAGSAPDLPGVVAFENGNSRAMAEAILQLMDAPARRAALGDEARAHVSSACTWAARASDLEAIYAEVLTG